ncbi:hypothetical protein Q8A73_011207 [Channa argus]|nr:hypothetical protein Q8A73_011207 [Channa argus]
MSLNNKSCEPQASSPNTVPACETRAAGAISSTVMVMFLESERRWVSKVGVLRYGQVQMALSQLSPNRISQNAPVTAGTCAPSQSGAATETNYHQQSSRCRVHGACASPSPYKVAKTRRQINGVVSVCQPGDGARFYGDSLPPCCS